MYTSGIQHISRLYIVLLQYNFTALQRIMPTYLQTIVVLNWMELKDKNMTG